MVAMFSFRKQSPVRLKNKPKPVRRIIDPNKRMLLRQLIIGFGLFVLLGLIVSGVWYGTRVSSLTIVTINATGGETIDHRTVESSVQRVLDGTYGGLIPRRFAWWYPERDVYTALQAIPRLKNPHVERVSGTTLTVSYDEYVPTALWCNDRTDAECLFIDGSGFAFTAAPKLTGGALLRFRTLGATPTIGNVMTTPEHLATMNEFIRLVSRNLKIEISSVEFDSADDVFYVLSAGGELRATLRDPALQVFDNLRTILASKEFTHIKPGNFQYIDLRFGSKVFVNEELEVATSTDMGTSTVLDSGIASTTR